MQIKGLLKESTYHRYSKQERIKLENGGILFEGALQEILSREDEQFEDSTQDENEEESIQKRGRVKAFSFIYPTSSTYWTKSECRIFELPESLRDKWLSFNPKVFAETLNIHPGYGSYHGSRTFRSDAMNTINRQKSILLGIPKGLTAENSKHKNMEGQKSNFTERSQAYKVQEQPVDARKMDTILPKGYYRQVSRVPLQHQAIQEENKQKTDSNKDKNEDEASDEESIGLRNHKTKAIKLGDDSYESGSSTGNNGEGDDEEQEPSDDQPVEDEEDEEDSQEVSRDSNSFI